MASPISLSRLLTLARPELGWLAVGTVALFLASALGLSYPLIVGNLLDGVVEGGGTDAVDRWAGILVLIFAGMGVATAMRAYLFTVAGERVVARLRQTLFGSLIHQEIGFFDQQRTGELTNRLASDTTVIQKAVTVNISMALRFVVQAIGAMIILAWISWKLTIVMLCVVPVVAAGAGLYGRLIRRVSRDVQDALAESTAVAEETLAGVRTVRAFARERHEEERYGTAVMRAFELARKRAWLGASFQGVVSFAGYGAIAAVLWYGGRMLSSGAMSFGELTSFLLYTFTVAFAIGAMAGLWEDFAKALGASERVFELMDRQPLVAGGDGTPANVQGRVRFDNVAFAYPSRKDQPVLVRLDMHLEPGEAVAVVGPSGAGKSTVAALLSRFYDPDGGTILLDGIPLTELSPDWLREQVGVVSQEPILFATTISENIRYGRPGASDAEVQAAAEAANAHEFVSGFPEGYDTMVGERGVRLSGGQKQRVAIARAVLKDPKVLVLDEATSALDAESEHLVQEALERLMQQRTTLVIAHRLSTVRDADRVVVLHDGVVAQVGSHDELVAQDGIYRRLVERQFAAA